MPKITEISLGSQMEEWVSVSSDRNTAVSRKVVLQTGKSLRDNVESYYG